MCSTSHVERHGKLLDSILGPCSGVAEGEITASLVGPFVGFHHQSLLIACYWPSGRGNIGYGANVGSNHTGKAPDQEIWPGEGCFFGLATAIKFPSNFIKSPYTLIATGVTTLPQRVEMPFSLINTASESVVGLSPALNEIMPGWILSDNLYMILRGETKFLKRGRKIKRLSKRTNSKNYDNEALRPTTVEMMIDARQRLQEVVEGECKYYDKSGGMVWTSKEIRGLGKNYMKEKTRVQAIRTYSDFILFYCVRAMWRALRDGEGEGEGKGEGKGKGKGKGEEAAREEAVLRGGGGGGASLVTALTASATTTVTRDERGRSAAEEWSGYGRNRTRIEMLEEHGMDWSVESALLKYVDLQGRFAQSVLVSKQKDDKRGPSVIDGYKEAHGTAENNDAVVAKAMREAEEERIQVHRYLERRRKRGGSSKL